MVDKPKNEIFVLPEARVLVVNLLERDVYKDKDTGAEGKPKYKVVLAFDSNQVIGEGTIEDKMADAIAATYGEATADEWLTGRADRISPLKDGNEIAKDREANGKDGEASKGKIILSADSIYNKDGVEGPGGFLVYGPDNQKYSPALHGDLYSGMYGCAAVTLHAYKDYPRKGDRGVKCYLSQFQKTREGPKLQAEKSSLFKPVAGASSSSSAEGGRRRRAG
jgi:hypothetical protein